MSLNGIDLRKNCAAGLLVLLCILTFACARTPAQRESRFLQRGKSLAEKQDYARALLEFKNAAQVMPKDAEPYFQMALAYMSQNDARSAYRSVKRATELNPEHTDAQLVLAKFLSGASDRTVLEEAQGHVREVLVKRPNDPDALNTLAAIETRLGKPDQAMLDLQTSIAQSPQFLLSSLNAAKLDLSRNNPTGAEAILKSAAKNSPNSAEAALLLAQFYLERNRHSDAEVEAIRAAQLDPKSAKALAMVAAFQIDAGKKDEAGETYRKIAALPDKSLKAIHAAYELKRGNNEAAITELSRLANEDPDNREIRQLLIDADLTAKKTQDAERVLNEALKRNPKDASALLQRSSFLLSAGKTNEAEKDLQTVIHFSPQSAEAHYGLAKVAAVRGATLVQRQELTDVLKADPNLLSARIDLSGLLRQGDAKAALDLLDSAPASQKQVPDYLVERNWVLMAAGQKSDLRRSLDETKAIAGLPVVMFQDAVLRVSQKDLPGARSVLDALLKREPDNTFAVELLANTYAVQGNIHQALAAVQKCAAQRPDSPFLLNILGEWSAKAGEKEQARKAFSAAVTANPDYLPPRLGLADLDVLSGNLPAARATLQDVLLKQPASTLARVRLGALEQQSGNHSAAREQFGAVAKAEPGNAAALNGLAFNLSFENPDEAMKYAQNAVELAPEEPSIVDTLGWVYYRKGLYENALRYFERSVRKQATAGNRYHLALAYAKTGNAKLARENMDAALKLDPRLVMPEPLAK